MNRLTWTKEVTGTTLDDKTGNELTATYKEYICPACHKTQHTLHINNLIVSGGYASSSEGECCIPCCLQILSRDFNP